MICADPKPTLPFVTCGVALRRNKETGQLYHPGRHAAFAKNPGNWTGNRPPAPKLAVTHWGEDTKPAKEDR